MLLSPRVVLQHKQGRCVASDTMLAICQLTGRLLQMARWFWDSEAPGWSLMCMLPSSDAAWGGERSPPPQAMHHQVGPAACQPGSALRRGRAAGREAGAPDLGHRRRLQLPMLRMMRRYLLLTVGRGIAGRGRSEVGLCAGCTVACSLRA